MKRRLLCAVMAAALALGMTPATAWAMKVFANAPSGYQITFDFERTDLIDNIRAEIAEKEGIPSEHVVLAFAGKTLEDGHTLEDYNVQINDAIDVAIADVTYVDENGGVQTADSTIAQIVENSGELSVGGNNGGWYVVFGNVAIQNRIKVSGDVKLILADGATLNAKKGIHVTDGSSLTVYGQENGTGTLKAIGETIAGNGTAGIGGDADATAGSITINGGVVSAQSGQGAAAIGAGLGGQSGTIVINGGKVTAEGNSQSHGIGNDGSLRGNQALPAIVINGGYVDTNCIHGTLETGDDGNAVIIAGNGECTPIENDSEKSEWNGVVFETDSTEGNVYGNVTLGQDFVVPDGKSLVVPEGATLTVPDGLALDVPKNCKVVVEPGRELVNQGTVNFGVTPIVGWNDDDDRTYFRAAPNVQGVFNSEDYAGALCRFVDMTGSASESTENLYVGNREKCIGLSGISGKIEGFKIESFDHLTTSVSG